ncbi:MAG: hypothetical protein PVJ76_19325 [Gemmatimonadota bacterium]|jgi:hypothetical protein
MLRRNLKLDGSYFVGELLIVTLGVLIALALDSWNEARLERRVEDEVLGWLISDVQSDTAFFTWWSGAVDDKLAALEQASVPVADPNVVVTDSLAFLEAVTVGSYYGWNQPSVRRTSFDELVSSGNLGLIDDPAVRRRIVEYYYAVDDSRGRMLARRSDYAPIAYRLIPRASEFVPRDMDGTQLRTVIEAVRRSDLSKHTVAETNLGLFIRSMITPLESLARDLLDELELYRESR